MSNTEDKNFKQEYLQKPITFLTEENLDKLEKHCNKAIHYERGIEHRVVLELLERYKEHLAERKQDKARIKELEEENKKLLENSLDVINDMIPKQKVKNRIKENKKLIDETYSEDIIQKLTDENEILEELLEDK